MRHIKSYISLTIFIGCFSILMLWNKDKNICCKVVANKASTSAALAIQEERLRRYIKRLAEEIGPRNIENQTNYEKLDETANYIEATMKDIGYTPNTYTYEASYKGKEFSVKNIEVVIEGSRPSDSYIVIGAHYDTVSCSPGADDNGSGVAALLEIARHLRTLDQQKIKTTIKLVAFPNEESPYSLDQKTGSSFGINMGSLVYAKQARAKNDSIIGMICLESIGYYSDAPGSQQYPGLLKILKIFHGDTGDFLVALGNLASSSFLKKFVKCFKENTNPFPIHAHSLPDTRFTKDIGRSDHKAFWLEGYPAIMLTDTANFRNNRYHTSNDTADSVSYKAFTKVVNQLCLTAEHLAMQASI